MSNFREFMAEDMSHLGACLFAASESARKILNFKVPATEGRIRKHEEIEMEFDLQLKHLREYLNGMWRGEQADEYDGPPQAIDEGEVEIIPIQGGPSMVIDEVSEGPSIARPVTKSTKFDMERLVGLDWDAREFICRLKVFKVTSSETSAECASKAADELIDKIEECRVKKGRVDHPFQPKAERDGHEEGEGPRRVRMPLIAGPIEKSSFKITPGDAAVLETMAKKLAQESKAFLEDIEEENEFLNSAAKAMFSFLDKISQPEEGGQVRISLEEKDIAVVGNMAALIHSNAKEAIEDLYGSRYMFPETEAAAEALFLFLRNRVK